MNVYHRQKIDALKAFMAALRSRIYTPLAPLRMTAWRTPEPVPFARRQSGQRLTLKAGDAWGSLFDCAWFRFEGRVPRAAAGQPVVLLIDINGELALVDGKGTPVCALTNVSSTYDYSLGEPGKRVFDLLDRARGGERIDLWGDAGCNDLFGTLKGDGRIVEAAVATVRPDIRDLYYDVEFLLDWLNELNEAVPEHDRIVRALLEAATVAGECDPAQVAAARRCLAGLLRHPGSDAAVEVSAIGHSHLDLAWLWPVRETIRKGARTFATANRLMDRYPDYVFGASQPQLYAWMKQHYPALYRTIRQRVRQGRIEPQGAMWVEADTNITGGESLVRQLLHGRRFFREAFGREVDYLWLPDVFGYSAALPQILRKSGVKAFMTQKLSWSLVNDFPCHSFVWRGIDGSEVLSHLLPEDTYNSPGLPRSVIKIERDYKERGVSRHTMLAFGIGDGGGGPGEEHLERLRRLRDVAGLPTVTQRAVADFIPLWARDAARFPAWTGELYLERHQGTFTTHGHVKRANRRVELALRSLEWMAAWAARAAGERYPAAWLDPVWKEVLLYQFHDVLPGSSIKRVYDECVPRLQGFAAEAGERTQALARALARRADTGKARQPFVVFNPLSWDRTEWIDLDGRWQPVTVPAMGYAVADAAAAAAVPPVAVTPRRLENDLLRVTLGADGTLVSVYDKALRREMLPAGERANALTVYEDTGDAWDFRPTYRDRVVARLTPVAVETGHEGPRGWLRHTFRFGQSELVQDIVLTAGSRRVDFVTRGRWRERNTMLRTAFPVAVHAEAATFEIQYGTLRRSTTENTTWEAAQIEVPAQRWVDLSQRDHGVALLNDCKYGHRVKGHVLDLNLIRSVPYPGPARVRDEAVEPGAPHDGYTDQRDHAFTYALYPHAGDHVAGRVLQAAHELNAPLLAVPAAGRGGPLPPSLSMVRPAAPNIVVEVVKQAEADGDLVVRAYETSGASTRTRLDFWTRPEKAWLTDLMEVPQAPAALRGTGVDVAFGPFEIQTLKVRFGKPRR